MKFLDIAISTCFSLFTFCKLKLFYDGYMCLCVINNNAVTDIAS